MSFGNTVKTWDVSTGACVYTFDIAELVLDLASASDAIALCLQTEIGILDVSKSLAICTTDNNITQRSESVSLGLSTDSKWITYRVRNLLWVPSEYRSSCSAFDTRRLELALVPVLYRSVQFLMGRENERKDGLQLAKYLSLITFHTTTNRSNRSTA